MGEIMEKVKVGIVGSRFISEIHARALKNVNDAEIIACASPNDKHVKKFASDYGIKNYL